MLSATVRDYGGSGSTLCRIYQVTCEDEAIGLDLVAHHPSHDPNWRLQVERTRPVKEYASPGVDEWIDV